MSNLNQGSNKRATIYVNIKALPCDDFDTRLHLVNASAWPTTKAGFHSKLIAIYSWLGTLRLIVDQRRIVIICESSWSLFTIYSWLVYFAKWFYLEIWSLDLQSVNAPNNFLWWGEYYKWVAYSLNPTQHVAVLVGAYGAKEESFSYWSRLVKISSIWRRVKCCHISWMIVYGSPCRVDYRSWLDCHNPWIVLKVNTITTRLVCFSVWSLLSSLQDWHASLDEMHHWYKEGYTTSLLPFLQDWYASLSEGYCHRYMIGMLH
jgi:hypothetical protein